MGFWPWVSYDMTWPRSFVCHLLCPRISPWAEQRTNGKNSSRFFQDTRWSMWSFFIRRWWTVTCDARNEDITKLEFANTAPGFIRTYPHDLTNGSYDGTREKYLAEWTIAVHPFSQQKGCNPPINFKALSLDKARHVVQNRMVVIRRWSGFPLCRR